MPMTAALYRWIESNHWELRFFGLPPRIPWPAEVPEAEAAKEPFEMNHLLDAIEAMGAEAGEPWASFYKAAEHLEEFGEAVENSEIVRACGLLEKFEEAWPGTAFALYHRGTLARLEGRDAAAAELLAQAAEKAPGGAAIWNSLGVIHATRGERGKAVEAFREALKIVPQDRTALEGLAGLREVVKLLRKADDADSAIYMDLPSFEKLALGQVGQLRDAGQLLNYGEQLLKEGFAKEAGLQALERAHALAPGDVRAAFSLTTGYRMLGRLEEARATIAKFIEQHPGDPRGHFQVAQLCAEAGDKVGERRALERVLEIDPNAQLALGIYFGLRDGEHDPAKEEELAKWAGERGSFMAYILAGTVARQRGDARRAVKWAEEAFALAPESEDVLLHYTAALGEARSFEKLAQVIKPRVESGKFSRRLNWNYAQVLQQSGLAEDAMKVLREVAAGADTPPEMKAAAATTMEAWSGELTGCGVKIEVHQAGFLQRPILLTIDGEEGGIVLAAGAKVPVAGSFPWRAAGAEARIALQQGESGGGIEPRPLGVFVVRGVAPGAAVECHLAAMPDGALHFRSTLDGKKLKVGWMPPGLEKR